MVYFLHGDDISSSRKRLTELIENMPVTFLDGTKLSVNVLEENISSVGLFEEKKAVVVENLMSKNVNKKKIIEFICDNVVNCSLIFWDPKKIIKTSFPKRGGARVEEFSLPSYYYKFLDSVTPGNKKGSFLLYQKLLKDYSQEQVFYSLYKRIRQLMVLESGSKNEEIEKMSPWQISNLNRQLRQWNKESLHKFYESLRQTEFSLKTGGLPVSLSKHLDILILTQIT